MMERNQFHPRPSLELCPFETSEWEKLKTNWNCTDPADYHCLPNQNNEPGQICVKPHWVLKNYCPIYNTAAAKIDLIPCDLQYGACSDNDYRSNEVLRYSGCLNKTEIYEESSTIKPAPSILSFSLIAGIIAVVIVLCLLVSIACFVHRRRRRKRRQNMDFHQMEPLLDQSSIPKGIQKTFDYLKSGVFSSSRFYEHAVGVLDCYGCVCLIGPPGSGKTFTAVQLAHRKYRKRVGGTSRLYVHNTVEEVISTHHTDGSYIIVDDWLNQYMYYPSKLVVDKERLDNIHNDLVKSKTAQVIFTAQEDRWKMFGDSFSKCALFGKQCLFTINSKTFDKNIQFKKNIIDNNLEHCRVVEENPDTRNLDNLKKNLLKVKGEAEFSFPLIINLICLNERMELRLDLILSDGFIYTLERFLDTWSKEKDMDERRSFCILVFAALHGGEVKKSDLTSRITGPTFERICNEYSCVQASGKCFSNEQELRKADKFHKTEKNISDKQSDISSETAQITDQSALEGNKNTDGQTSHEDTSDVERLLRENKRLRSCLYKVKEDGKDPVFVFQHNALLRFVLQHIFKSNKKRSERFFIENASIEIFMKNCWIEKGIVDKLRATIDHKILASPAGLVIIPTSALEPLAERLYSETAGLNTSQWSDHICFTHEIFKKTWKKLVERNSKEGPPQ